MPGQGFSVASTPRGLPPDTLTDQEFSGRNSAEARLALSQIYCVVNPARAERDLDTKVSQQLLDIVGKRGGDLIEAVSVHELSLRYSDLSGAGPVRGLLSAFDRKTSVTDDELYVLGRRVEDLLLDVGAISKRAPQISLGEGDSFSLSDLKARDTVEIVDYRGRECRFVTDLSQGRYILRLEDAKGAAGYEGLIGRSYKTWTVLVDKGGEPSVDEITISGRNTPESEPQARISFVCIDPAFSTSSPEIGFSLKPHRIDITRLSDNETSLELSRIEKARNCLVSLGYRDNRTAELAKIVVPGGDLLSGIQLFRDNRNIEFTVFVVQDQKHGHLKRIDAADLNLTDRAHILEKLVRASNQGRLPYV